MPRPKKPISPDEFADVPLPAELTHITYASEKAAAALAKNPYLTAKALARQIELDEPQVIRLVRSRSFLRALEKYPEAAKQAVLVQDVRDMMEALAYQAIEVLMRELATNPEPDTAISAIRAVAPALLGVSQNATSVNFVALVPPQASSEESWQATLQGKKGE